MELWVGVGGGLSDAQPESALVAETGRLNNVFSVKIREGTGLWKEAKSVLTRALVSLIQQPLRTQHLVYQRTMGQGRNMIMPINNSMGVCVRVCVDGWGRGAPAL